MGEVWERGVGRTGRSGSLIPFLKHLLQVTAAAAAATAHQATAAAAAVNIGAAAATALPLVWLMGGLPSSSQIIRTPEPNWLPPPTISSGHKNRPRERETQRKDSNTRQQSCMFGGLGPRMFSDSDSELYESQRVAAHQGGTSPSSRHLFSVFCAFSQPDCRLEEGVQVLQRPCNPLMGGGVETSIPSDQSG